MKTTVDAHNESKDNNMFNVKELPPRLVLDLQSNKCNLRCPKCPVHGSSEYERVKFMRGSMSFDNLQGILDEVMVATPLIQPCLYSEPLLDPNFCRNVTAMKERGIAVAVNTNGLLLTEDLARFFVEKKIDSIFFSIDAMTGETFKRIKGIDKFKVLEMAVHEMLMLREDRAYPRIGVSFTIEEENRHEKEKFVDYWSKHVDVIRVNELYVHEKFVNVPTVEKRTVCRRIFNSMVIRYDGDVSLCCLDGFKVTQLGNVFKNGVKGVWKSEEFSLVRHYHETGQYEKVPFCKNCNGWMEDLYEDEMVGNLLIRRSPLTVYYNRIDRLSSWKGNLLGGHEPPATDIVKKSVKT